MGTVYFVYDIYSTKHISIKRHPRSGQKSYKRHGSVVITINRPFKICEFNRENNRDEAPITVENGNLSMQTKIGFDVIVCLNTDRPYGLAGKD